MAGKVRMKGECYFCGRKLTNSGMAKHLQTCEKRSEAIAAAVTSGNDEILCHLQIQDFWDGDFWLHLEISGNATLETLDSYLRDIWLECCGHLSQFSLSKRGDEIPMNRKAGQIFREGLELIHIYDFGTSSETKIKVVSSRKGSSLTPHPIALMARNDPPEYNCAVCGSPASWLCLECLYERDGNDTFCDKHIEEHPHDEYGEPVPLVNSPRVGMCGYTGPAYPPYGLVGKKNHHSA